MAARSYSVRGSTVLAVPSGCSWCTYPCRVSSPFEVLGSNELTLSAEYALYAVRVVRSCLDTVPPQADKLRATGYRLRATCYSTVRGGGGACRTCRSCRARSAASCAVDRQIAVSGSIVSLWLPVPPFLASPLALTSRDPRTRTRTRTPSLFQLVPIPVHRFSDTCRILVHMSAMFGDILHI